MPIKKVFLSSTASDLKEYREAAYRAIEGLDGYHCVRMEDFGARNWDADEFCRAKVGECDLFVGIVGYLYGSCPEGSDQSYTEREYEAALDAGKTMLMFVAPRIIPVPDALKESKEKYKKQRAFRERVGGIIGSFRTPNELAMGVTQAIRNEEFKSSEIENRASRVPFQAPPLPEHFISRPDVSDDLKRRLLTNISDRTGVLVVSALHGLGGIGKTVLAASLAHDKEVRNHFSDGVLWATLGKVPDLLSLLSGWIQALGDYGFRPTTPEAASMHLSTLLYDKTALLVVDNAWNSAHVQLFRVGGPNCSLLITTRDALIAEAVGARIYDLDVMTPEQSLALLSNLLKRELKGRDRENALNLAKSVGYLPLALGISASRIKDGVPWNEVIESTLRDLETRKIPNDSSSSQIGDLLGASDDQVATDDQLGFKYYVEAFADLIESPYTSRPLTIGIYGSWGMGKSFLLKHIAKSLNQRRNNRITEGIYSINVHVVNFNAWEYSASEIVWPGLVRKIMDQLEPKREISKIYVKYFKSKLARTLKKRFQESQGRFIFSIIVLLPISFVILWLNLDPTSFWGQIKTFGLAIGASGLVSFALGLLKLTSYTLKPLSQWTTNLFQNCDYGRQIGYMEDIHDDLKFLENRLSGDERILIIIDDLDRCEPEKAVEVLQAINLLLNFESFIIFMGIDARIITRAVENHYKGLLGPAGASGYEYLEKVVQIPFRIPEPNTNDIKQFIAEQFGDLRPRMTGNFEPRRNEAPDLSSGGIQTEFGDQKGQETYKSEDEVSTLRGPSVPFTYAEQKAFQDLARFLRPNPRHLKRLINVYRIVRALAAYKNEHIILHNPVATIRWLVICGQWPYTTYSMLRYFDKMIGDREENKLDELPSDVDPLTYLLEEVGKNKELFSADRQSKLDHDSKLLSQLLQCKEGRLNWDELEVIRQYTVNFNPAIEAELINETGIKQD